MTTGEVIALIKAFGGGGGGSSGGGVLVVNMVDDYTDKTWKEIHDAPTAVIVQEMATPGSTAKFTSPVLQVYHDDGGYTVYYQSVLPNGTVTPVKLVTDSENGYLTYAE